MIVKTPVILYPYHPWGKGLHQNEGSVVCNRVGGAGEGGWVVCPV